MSAIPNTPEHVREQYADPANLSARAELHRRFGTNPYGWYAWAYDQLDLPAEARILELGCGTGGLWLANRDRVPPGWDIVLSDHSPGMLREASERLSGWNRVSTFQVIDAQAIPFADEHFDAVVANHMLYHVPELPEAFAEIRRALKTGGHLYAATNGRGHMRELRELARTVTTALRFSDPDRRKVFGLENGTGLLEPRFSNVTPRHYENALRVTEVEPLVAYVLSTANAKAILGDEDVERLRRAVRERIDADGAVHISISTGMFIAERPEEMTGQPLTQ